MIWFARALRIGLVGACVSVLSGIVPISVAQFRLGDACPTLGFVPACYVVTAAYSAMALAGLIWWRGTLTLFLFGAVPVITLAVMGTVSEIAGVPTCPRSNGGWPLCYASLAIGLGVLLAFLSIRAIETRRFSPNK